MLTAPAFRRRIAQRTWALAFCQRSYAQGERRTNGDEKAPRSKSKGRVEEGGSTQADQGKPSLIERLFPERYAVGGTHRDAVREVPRIPTEGARLPTPELQRVSQDEGKRPDKGELLRRTMESQPPNTSVLVLRNAGKNLTEEDFRRVIPQGKHLEGWTLEQGDILRIIPGRDLQTLEQTGYYFLLFSSPLSAFTYQGHVTRIHRMVTANSPSSLLSPIAPPPGYMLEGMDAHDAINSFTLIPPDQSLQLRQLRPPLSPVVQSLVQYGGYEALVKRKDRMPYEARLTLEGPQLQLPAIRHILRTSGRDRGLSWAGDENEVPKLGKWEPLAAEGMPSPSSKSELAFDWSDTKYKREFLTVGRSSSKENATNDGPADNENLKRRTPRPVYIVGFTTERALHSFVHFWHGRPLAWEGTGKISGNEEGDLPPVVHVEVLW